MSTPFKAEPRMGMEELNSHFGFQANNCHKTIHTHENEDDDYCHSPGNALALNQSWPMYHLGNIEHPDNLPSFRQLSFEDSKSHSTTCYISDVTVSSAEGDSCDAMELDGFENEAHSEWVSLRDSRKYHSKLHSPREIHVKEALIESQQSTKSSSRILSAPVTPLPLGAFFALSSFDSKSNQQKDQPQLLSLEKKSFIGSHGLTDWRSNSNVPILTNAEVQASKDSFSETMTDKPNLPFGFDSSHYEANYCGYLHQPIDENFSPELTWYTNSNTIFAPGIVQNENMSALPSDNASSSQIGVTGPDDLFKYLQFPEDVDDDNKEDKCEIDVSIPNVKEIGKQGNPVRTNHRTSRSRLLPELSDPHTRYPRSIDQYKLDLRELGRGMQSGRNLFAIFANDTQPRTIYDLVIHRGRKGKDASENHPDSAEPLPRGLTLSEICQLYPNHVWGSGLRIFICEGWDEERIWHTLPSDVRHNSAKTRHWNYIQQACGRELDKMHQEETGRRRIPQKRRLLQEEHHLSTITGGDQPFSNSPMVTNLFPRASAPSTPSNSLSSQLRFIDGSAPLIHEPTFDYNLSFKEQQSQKMQRLALDHKSEQIKHLKLLRSIMNFENPMFHILPLTEQHQRITLKWQDRCLRWYHSVSQLFQMEIVSGRPLLNPISLLVSAYWKKNKAPDELRGQAIVVWRTRRQPLCIECCMLAFSNSLRKWGQEWEDYYHQLVTNQDKTTSGNAVTDATQFVKGDLEDPFLLTGATVLEENQQVTVNPKNSAIISPLFRLSDGATDQIRTSHSATNAVTGLQDEMVRQPSRRTHCIAGESCLASTNNAAAAHPLVTAFDDLRWSSTQDCGSSIKHAAKTDKDKVDIRPLTSEAQRQVKTTNLTLLSTSNVVILPESHQGTLSTQMLTQYKKKLGEIHLNRVKRVPAKESSSSFSQHFNGHSKEEGLPDNKLSGIAAESAETTKSESIIHNHDLALWEPGYRAHKGLADDVPVHPKDIEYWKDHEASEFMYYHSETSRQRRRRLRAHVK